MKIKTEKNKTVNNVNQGSIEYCLFKEDNKCKEFDGCFHIFKNKPNNDKEKIDSIFKKNILIYGPNGAGKTSLFKNLNTETIKKTYEVIAFNEDFVNKHICINRKNSIEQKRNFSTIINFQTDDLKVNREKRTKLVDFKKIFLKKRDNFFNDFWELICKKYLNENSNYHQYTNNWKEFISNNQNIFNFDKTAKNDNYNFNLEDINNDEIETKFKSLSKSHFLKINDEENEFRKTFDEKNIILNKVFFDKKLKEIKEDTNSLLNVLKQYKEAQNNSKEFNIWFDEWLSKWPEKPSYVFELEDKDKIFKWLREGMDLYLNKDVCLLCLRKELPTKETLKKIKSLPDKTQTDLKNQLKERFKKIKDKINVIYKDKRFAIEIKNLESIFKKLIGRKSWDIINWNLILNKINQLKQKHKTKIKNETSSLNVNDLFESLINTSLFKKTKEHFNYITIDQKIKTKLNYFDDLITAEEEADIKELNILSKEIQKKWNYKKSFKLKRHNRNKEGKCLISFVGDIKGNFFSYLSTGELKSFAIIIFFFILEQKMKKAIEKQYIIVFDDIFDQLDFSVNFKLKNLLGHFLKKIKKHNEKIIKHIIFLTHQFDFVTFFNHWEYPKEKFFLHYVKNLKTKKRKLNKNIINAFLLN